MMELAYGDELEADGTLSRSVPIRVVSFNAWALPVRIPSQQKRRRLMRLPEALAALDADVIVLQEMFDVRGRRRLLDRLCPPYQPAPRVESARRLLGIVPIDATGGLLVLSRYPVSGSRFVPHVLGAGTKPDERLGRKGALIVRLDTPLGPLTVFAIHLYAGTKAKDREIRCRQLPPLLETLDAEAGGGPVVLAGDINTSPTAAYPAPPGSGNSMAPEYEALARAGFIDPLPPGSTSAERSATWVPSRNRYTALPYQETKTDERYDYVMVRPGAAHRWEVKGARTVLDSPGGHLSDHIGVLVDIELLTS